MVLILVLVSSTSQWPDRREKPVLNLIRLLEQPGERRGKKYFHRLFCLFVFFFVSPGLFLPISNGGLPPDLGLFSYYCC